MVGTLWAALAVPVVTIIICYGLWLGAGCSPFWPFISDLGIDGSSMETVFSGGLTSTAFLIAVVLVDSVVVRLHANHSRCFCLVQAYTLLVGCVLVAGIVHVGSLPWNRELYHHLIWAFRLFGAGFGVSLGNTISLWMLQTSSPEEHPREPWAMRLSVFLLVLSALIFTLMHFVAKTAFPDIHALGHMLHEARVDFHAYCTKKSFDAVSVLAVMEWLYVMCLIGGLATLRQDIEIWCSADSREPLLPRLAKLKGQSDGL